MQSWEISLPLPLVIPPELKINEEKVEPTSSRSCLVLITIILYKLLQHQLGVAPLRGSPGYYSYMQGNEMKIIELKSLKVSQEPQCVCLLIRFRISGSVFVSRWDLSKSISIHKSPQITQCAHQSRQRYDLKSINCAINWETPWDSHSLGFRGAGDGFKILDCLHMFPNKPSDAEYCDKYQPVSW